MAILDKEQRLKKDLGLFDVFAVSTGAMFSSGFFLLPGLAAAQAGPSVFLAYLFAGVLILPAMFSAAELSTALPRAGGAYFFLDRSLGPMVGTIGGLGTFLALTLKSAFALIGIGAYAAFFIELPIKPVAIALTVVFVVINIVGAKETTTLQRWLVVILLAVLAFFTIQGVMHLVAGQPVSETRGQFAPFLPFGVEGLLSTIGFVFVSYAGLTKVASISEEVKNPDRNLPLGMMLSLAVTTLIYVVGVFIMVSVLDASALRSDLTPVATASDAFFTWLPGELGLMLVVAAAMAAFLSTGNAGLMSASRYPLAMARDRLLPDLFSRLGRFHTPVPAILASGALMIFFILVLDAAGIAKLASAFQLLIFMLLNFAVVVMRESRIESYDPGFRSPLYPWMQIFGVVTSLLLIVYMGYLAMLFTAGVVVVCLAWYAYYVKGNVSRDGAIYHWFRRLGAFQDEGLDAEFRSILKEKGLRGEDPYDELVARSLVLDIEEETSFEQVVRTVSEMLATRLPKSADQICSRFLEGAATGATPVTRGVALPHFRTELVEDAELVLVRSKYPVMVSADDPLTDDVEDDVGVETFFFLVSPENDPGRHLRILAQLAGRVDEADFADDWRRARGEQGLREIMLRHDRYVTVKVSRDGLASDMIGLPLKQMELPADCLVAMIRRGNQVVVPRGDTVIRDGDLMTIIGSTEGIATVRESIRKRE